MNQEAFIDWALDNTRTVEERFTVEILVEFVMFAWHIKHKTGCHDDFRAGMERDRQRYLNPAYVPGYSEDDLRHAVEIWVEKKFWWVSLPYQKRPIRDISALQFFTQLVEIKIGGSEIADASVFAGLPNLRVLEFASETCQDFRPFARCTQIRSLKLELQSHWPKLDGLDKLEQLETFHLTGNLITLRPGLVWPNVRTGTLKCQPLAVRSVRDLPRFPACEFLQLGGVDDLDGIEAFPRLRNLSLTGVVRDFAPLAVLDNLTCFNYDGAEPLDVTPLTRLPRLHFASFNSKHEWNIDKVKPRDYMPLLDAPQFREIKVTGCPPVNSEVANLNTLFPAWDELFLLPEPLPLRPLKFIVAPNPKHPLWPEVALEPEDHGLADSGLRECEGRWVQKFVHRTVTARVGGHPEWGEVNVYGQPRTIRAMITCFSLIEKFPAMLDGLREALARLRPHYNCHFSIHLKAPGLEATPEQIEMEKQFIEERDEDERERHDREHKEYLDRLYRLDLKKQSGEKINPQEFAVPPSEPPLQPPWEREEEWEDDDDAGDGDVAVKKKPDPPPSWLDDAHPLAHEYMMYGQVSLLELWVISYGRHIATYLMGREPDLEIPEDPK